MKFGKVLFGVGLGVLAGLLFAPKKGSELREDIKAKSKSTYDYLANLTREDVEAKLGETIEKRCTYSCTGTSDDGYGG